jgi:erythromycin esterase-like protein
MKSSTAIFYKALSILPAALLVLLFVFPSGAFAQAAKPLDPIDGINNAFKTHDVVALGEGDHGNEQGAAFRAKLYRDSRFQAVVNDIVVESGNGRYQAMMDRYIAGEPVAEKELRMAWLETTQPTDVWDRDIYADMFRTIREINQKLPKEKQLRVLLGDTPYPSDPANPGADAALGHFSCGVDPARSDGEEAQGADRLWRHALSAQRAAANARPTGRDDCQPA